MVISHSMDVFVPMVMSSFMGLSASINSKHDCAASPVNSYPVIRNFSALLSQICVCFCLLRLCFILRACLPQLSRIAGKSCGFLPPSQRAPSFGKNHPRARPKGHSPQLCYRISFYGKLKQDYHHTIQSPKKGDDQVCSPCRNENI